MPRIEGVLLKTYELGKVPRRKRKISFGTVQEYARELEDDEQLEALYPIVRDPKYEHPAASK